MNALPSSENSSILSDASSAPLFSNDLLNSICHEYSKYVHSTGRVLPPTWTMPDLVRTVFGEDGLTQDSLTDAYYDVMICGIRSWGCEEVINFLDLINYVF